jgi:four helix bundle protein
LENWTGIVLQIYNLTKQKDFAADFALRDQIRRASISIISNSAEGYENQTTNVFIRHLSIAKGSSGEVRSQLYIAWDQKYITEEEFKSLAELCRKTSRQLSSLIKYLKSPTCNLKPALSYSQKLWKTVRKQSYQQT